MEKDSEELEDLMEGQDARALEALSPFPTGQQEIVGKELVLDKETKEYRPVRYGDIVILLRSASGWSETFTSGGAGGTWNPCLCSIQNRVFFCS